MYISHLHYALYIFDKANVIYIKVRLNLVQLTVYF